MSDFKAKILQLSSSQATVKFRVNIPCAGELLIADLYDIGEDVYLEGIQIGTTNGGNIDDEITLSIDASTAILGEYSLIVRTVETGLIARGIVVIAAEDGQAIGEIKTKIAYFGSPLAYVNFRVVVPCSGEVLIADLYSIEDVILYEGIQIGTTNGGNIDDEITVPLDIALVAIANYVLKVRTVETGLVAKGVVVMAAEDGQSLTALTE